MKVLYLPKEGNIKFKKLTRGKVYDVLEIYNSGSHKQKILRMINDLGEMDIYLYVNDFKDVIEFRNSVIDDILF